MKHTFPPLFLLPSKFSWSLYHFCIFLKSVLHFTRHTTPRISTHFIRTNMVIKFAFCVTALLVNLQVVRSDESPSTKISKISEVQTKIKNLYQKVDTDINQQIQDIMSRINFIRDQEVSTNKLKLADGMKEEIAALEALLTESRREEPEKACLKEVDIDFAKAITEAGNSHFESCVSNYPPGGSVNMDISDVKQNFDELEMNTNIAMKDCNQEDHAEAELCIVQLDEAFEEELVRLKESKLTHMKAEATEAEILERVKMGTCMKEALTNARVKKNIFKDQIQNCIADEPSKIDPKFNLAFPRV